MLPETVREAVREVAEGLNGDILAVGLFGSIARGDFGPHSDIDVFVITRRPLSLEEQDRIYEIFAQALAPRFGRDVTVLVYDLAGLKRVPTWHTLVMVHDAVLAEDRAGIQGLFQRILQEAEAHGIIYNPTTGTFQVIRAGRVFFL